MFVGNKIDRREESKCGKEHISKETVNNNIFTLNNFVKIIKNNKLLTK
jgi:hypothetical protein